MNIVARKRVLAAGVILGLLTAIMVYAYLSGSQKPPPPPPKEIQIVVASHDIPAGTIMEPGMVKLKTILDTEKPTGLGGELVASTDEVMGKIAAESISAEQPITRNQLVEKYRLSHMVPYFMRAVTIPIDMVKGVGGFPKVGDRVDVIAVFEVNEGTYAKTILQNVMLLAYGMEMTREKPMGAPEGQSQQPGTAATATLALSPSDAEKLVLAETKARLRLVLRRADDKAIVHTAGIFGNKLLPRYIPPDTVKSGGPRVDTRWMVSPPSKGGKGQTAPWTADIRPIPGGTFGPESITSVGREKKIEIVRGSELQVVTVGE